MMKIILLLLVFSLGLQGCAGSTVSESTGEFIDSVSITTKVKARLLERLGPTALSIRVRTFKAHVQLSGFVNNQRIKDRAGTITAGTTGVNQVRNDLVVK